MNWIMQYILLLSIYLRMVEITFSFSSFVPSLFQKFSLPQIHKATPGADEAALRTNAEVWDAARGLRKRSVEDMGRFGLL